MLTTGAAHLVTNFQAIVLGILQGITELFPVSSLGHTVIFPNLFGWHNIVRWQSQPESPWLAFVVALHVGSAIGLLIYFWRTWIDVIRGFFVSLWRSTKQRRFVVENSTERLAWLIVLATIPVGILGLILEHPVRVALAKPLAASIFLIVNGCILLSAERLRRRADVRALATREGTKRDGTSRRLDTMEYREGFTIGAFQTLALIAGISRDGIVMTAGLLRGLDNEDAARFAFLLATPPILAAGLLKFGDLTGKVHLNHGYATAAQAHDLRVASLIALIVAAVVAVFTVHFLTRYFKRANLIPFGIYCVVFGLAMVIYNA
ncbi:MAG TPA: undecaprenyl-diphosphate phosphatase [Solirubrobacteraceae bacterium]|nr:undecaprenyl-diphosphate phosphatase [Solirubrobacteraceae bacterium]